MCITHKLFKCWIIWYTKNNKTFIIRIFIYILKIIIKLCFSTESQSTHSSIVEKLPESVSSGSVMSCFFETNLVQKHPHCCKNEELNDNTEADLRNPKTTAECPIVHHVSLATSNSACSSYSSSEEISFREQQEVYF